MYNTYEADAFVFKSLNYDKYQKVLLFTKQFGLMWVQVYSTNQMKSKLRKLTQDFSFIKVFIIFGKKNKKIIGGELKSNLFFSAETHRQFIILKKAEKFLENNLILNESVEDIFFEFEKLYNDIFRINDIKTRELLFFKNILSYLGYLNIDDKIKTKKEMILSINNILNKV